MKTEINNLLSKAKALAELPSPEYKNAFILLQEAKEMGSGEAAFAIGSWYFHGIHLDRQVDKAVENWKIAAKYDNCDAMIELAKYYENNEYTERDISKAMGYYMNAALLGDAQSAYEIGRIYFHGIDIVADQFIADVWLSIAEKRGFVDH